MPVLLLSEKNIVDSAKIMLHPSYVDFRYFVKKKQGHDHTFFYWFIKEFPADCTTIIKFITNMNCFHNSVSSLTRE